MIFQAWSSRIPGRGFAGRRSARSWYGRGIWRAAAGALAFSPVFGYAQSGSDSFGSATVITGGSGIVTGSNVGATAQSGEPGHAEYPATASLWWQWRAPDSGSVSFDTSGSDFDTVLAVYEGATLADLILVAENDDYGDGYQSAVVFETDGGTTYWIAVDGFDGETGDIVLSWSRDLDNDAFADAAEIVGASGNATCDNIDATDEPGEPDHAGEPGGASLWWRWTAVSSGSVAFSTAGSNFDTVLAVYQGATLADLIPVAENDDSGGGRQSAVVFEAEGGTTYWIAVDGFDGETGDVVLSWGQGLENDAFADAAEISGASGSSIGDNIDATEEPGEPDHAGEPGGASVWWQWTAPSDGDVTFDTFGSGFTTALAVYTGDDLGSLIEVVSDVDYEPDSQSLVEFTAAAGTIYLIAVDGVVWEPGLAPTSGPVVLRWGPPHSHDDFASALVIEGLSGGTTGTNLGATAEPGEPEHTGALGGASVWWQWTAPDTGVVTFDTFGSNFDTILAVYTGEDVDALTLVADNDDAGDDYQSLVSFAAAAGTTYRIAVDGFEGDTGDITLDWSWTPVSDEPLRIESVGIRPDGSFGFVLQGPAGASGAVLRWGDPGGWAEWLPFTLDGGALEITDPDAAGPGAAPARIYRTELR